MRIFLVLICSVALACAAGGAQEENKSKKQAPKKNQAQSTQHAAAPGGGAQKGKGSQKLATPGGHRTAVTQPPSVTQKSAGGRSAEAGANPKHTSVEAYHGQQSTYHGQKGNKGQTSVEAYHGQKGKKGQTSTGAYEVQKNKKGQTSVEAYRGQKNKKGQTSVEAYHGQKGKKGQTPMGAYEGQTGKVAKGGKVTGATVATGKPLKPQHFKLPKEPNTAKAPAVKFQQGKHIEGSEHWQGQQYAVFRNYKSEWHDQGWWHSHYGNNIVWTFGAPYYFNSGYWLPAWGYAPNAYYAWDGPIYAYNRLPPDQVIANVQSALQQQGYYHGEVDGLIGPLTRGAIADYQRDHGLYTTSTIDQPTLESLGMA